MGNFYNIINSMEFVSKSKRNAGKERFAVWNGLAIL